MTKRFTAAVAALLCAAVGILRWVDLAGNTDPATGFLLSGQVPIRYLLLALPVLAILLAALTIPADVRHRIPAGAMVPAFCGMLFSGIIGVGLFALGHSTPIQLAAGLLLALGCLWFAGYVLDPARPPLAAGLLGTAGWLLITLSLFSSKVASIHHTLKALELLCTLAMLLQMVGLLRTVYLNEPKGASRTAYIRGMLGFYCGLCLLLPQEVWQWQNGLSVGCMQGKCIAAAALGITGLVTALHCAFDEGETVVNADDPAAVQAAFDQAGRQLEQALEDMPAADTQPRRWQSAASTLYGAAPQPAPAPVARPVQPPVKDLFAESNAAAPAPALSPEARPVIVTGSTDAPPQPTPKKAEPPKPAPQPIPVPVVKPAAPKIDTSVPVPKAAPGATATMDRLDDLLGQLETRDAGHDPLEDILAGLGTLEKPDIPNATPAEGEKWVFRR